MNISTITLPKWSAMIVEGDSVSPELAAEILIRTDSNLPYFTYAGNDTQLGDELIAIFNVPTRAKLIEYYKLNKLKDKLKVLHLNYLTNDRIVSSWVAGLYDWVNWYGTVDSRNYNIGKWPNVDSVLQDWQAIATAFPSLKLTCWLYSKETCVPDNTALVQFDIVSGTATAHLPDREPQNPAFGEPDYSSIMCSNRESGISVSSLKDKLTQIYGRIPKYSTRNTKK